jgi:hypothetical protein
MIGMLLEELFNLLAVLSPLLLQPAQELAQAQRQLAFGFADAGRSFELISSGKDLTFPA